MFKKFFNYEGDKNIEWISLIINKIHANYANDRYIRKFSLNTISTELKSEFISAVTNGVFSQFTDPADSDSDLFLEGIDTFTIDLSSYVGKPTTEASLISEVFRNRISALVDIVDNSVVESFSFPPIMADKYDNLFKLTLIDDQDMSRQIINESIMMGGFINPGSKAVYQRIEGEGTKGLLNFGFTKEDGSKLYKHAYDNQDDETLEEPNPKFTEKDIERARAVTASLIRSKKAIDERAKNKTTSQPQTGQSAKPQANQDKTINYENDDISVPDSVDVSEYFDVDAADDIQDKLDDQDKGFTKPPKDSHTDETECLGNF